MYVNRIKPEEEIVLGGISFKLCLLGGTPDRSLFFPSGLSAASSQLPFPTLFIHTVLRREPTFVLAAHSALSLPAEPTN